MGYGLRLLRRERWINILHYCVAVALTSVLDKCEDILNPVLINQGQVCKIKIKEQYVYTAQNSDFGKRELEFLTQTC